MNTPGKLAIGTTWGSEWPYSLNQILSGTVNPASFPALQSRGQEGPLPSLQPLGNGYGKVYFF